ncbi:MAG TPA: 4'-phosphopantetheinyl transferase superfamily protein [Solirubrobacterales bacterium]|nr:4'-phosphopantetheinyl transferase superfamily protein [Solirubrobacterales bacterium]
MDKGELDPDPDSFSGEELERAERIGSERLRRRFLARRWMARTLLAEAAGEAPGDLVLERRCERCGGLHPASPLAVGGREVWWSASHSGDLAAVAIASARVGLDLELERERPRWERIAERFFNPEERRALAGSPTRFLELWTLKEAYLKALGLGLPGGLNALDCSGLTATGEWSESDAQPGWRFQNFQPRPGFVAAVAVQGPATGVELRRWR